MVGNKGVFGLKKIQRLTQTTKKTLITPVLRQQFRIRLGEFLGADLEHVFYQSSVVITLIVSCLYLPNELCHLRPGSISLSEVPAQLSQKQRVPDHTTISEMLVIVIV
jgi:hypothetical protein